MVSPTSRGGENQTKTLQDEKIALFPKRGAHRGTEGCIMEKPFVNCINLIAYRVLISSGTASEIQSWKGPRVSGRSERLRIDRFRPVNLYARRRRDHSLGGTREK